MQERRKNERVNVHIDVNISNHEGDMDLGHGTILDLGLGGMKVETSAAINVKERVVLLFNLEKEKYMEQEQVQVVGEVENVWSKAGENINVYGFRLASISLRDKEYLKHYISFAIREQQNII